MPEGRGRVTRFALSAAVATALVCATFGAVASSALAWGDSDRDSYTVNISPASAPAGKSTTFDVALTNTSSPGSGLASAEIVPPLGFWVTGASLPTGASGRVHVFFNIVLLDHLSVPPGSTPGSTLHVSVQATTPSRCNSPFSRWFTDANEGGFFSEDLRLDTSNSSLTTPVTCATATGLQFGTQPSDALVGDVITGTPNDPSGPPVTVKIVDGSGNLVDSSAQVTVTLGNNPGGANLGGATMRNAVHGVATFNNLTLDKPDNGYSLVASSFGLTNSTSGNFNENNTATPCPANETCTGTPEYGERGSLKVDVGIGARGRDPHRVGRCRHRRWTLRRTSDTPPRTSRRLVRVRREPGSDRSKTVTWTVNNTSSYGFKVCFGAPYEFTVRQLRTRAPSRPAPAGRCRTARRGSSGSCPTAATEHRVEWAVRGEPHDDREATTTGAPESNSVVAVVTIPAGLTGDPFMAR